MPSQQTRVLDVHPWTNGRGGSSGLRASGFRVWGLGFRVSGLVGVRRMGGGCSKQTDSCNMDPEKWDPA